MTALEIYNQDILDREQGEPLPRQQYYTALRDALHRELMQQGYSDFLEQVLLHIRGKELQRLYVLDYAALMECHSMIMLGRAMTDATEYVPHLQLRGGRASWAAVEKRDSFLTISPDMVDKIKQLRAVSSQLVGARDDAVIPQADDAAQREIEQVHALNKLLNERCKALELERDELKARIRFLEEGVITEQVRFAIEARRIEEEESLARHYEAQREAAKSAFREQFAREQAEEKQRLENEERLLSGVRAEAAQDYAAVRQGMASDLRQLTALLEAKVNAWDRALDRAECRMLATTYTALHGLWASDMEKVILDAQCTGVDAGVTAALTEVHHQLRDRLTQLEQAMSRLGLIVIRPVEGEAFNGAFHLPVGTSSGAVGGTLIARCLTPGVMVQGAQDALLKAEVELA